MKAFTDWLKSLTVSQADKLAKQELNKPINRVSIDEMKALHGGKKNDSKNT